MAHTARNEEEKKEFFDSPEVLDKKASQMVDMIRSSKHFIVFTGAGISTAAGIPDFRSGMDTKLETGPGAWELSAHGQRRSAHHKVTSSARAVPTPTHMMFVKLMEVGLLKAVVSQNCDGLHRRSGLPVDNLFELHGNGNVERCEKCDRHYLRDYGVRTSHGLRVHLTGRKCDDPKCGGDLADTIINFGEYLPDKILTKSFEHAERADLCLAMGSSLTVTPAADIPKIVGEKQKLVIVNLQRTPLDRLADLRVFARCDDFTHLVMSKLSLAIPEFRLKRRLFVKASTNDKETKVILEQVDMEGHPFSYLKGVEFGGVVSRLCDPKKDLLGCIVPKSSNDHLTIQLHFQGHYGEPPLSLPLELCGKDLTVDVGLTYNPFTREWEVTRSDDVMETLASSLSDSKV